MQRKAEHKAADKLIVKRSASVKTAAGIHDNPIRSQLFSLHNSLGNQAVRRLFESGTIQAKLTVGRPNDLYEQEADRVADEVMRMPEEGQECAACGEKTNRMRPSGSRITPFIRRQAVPDEEEEPLQAKSKGSKPEVSSTLEKDIDALEGRGEPLSAKSRAFFEPRFGRDFSKVRVHADSHAAQLARSVNARAFTQGDNIVFGSGEYRPGSAGGRRLMGHELTHVVQQSNTALKRFQTLLSDRHIIQRRRIPSHSDLSPLVGDSNADKAVNRSGLALLVRRALSQMKRQSRRKVRQHARRASKNYWYLPKWKRDLLLARAIYDLFPALRYGDPGSSKVSVRNSNLRRLIAGANRLFDLIGAGKADVSIGQVFGKSNIGKAKSSYRNAKQKMNALYRRRRIYTDPSGHDAEVGVPGSSNSNEIILSPKVIETPDSKVSVITLIHESMHAGSNNTIGDFGYIETGTAFVRMKPDRKLINAAHYEVVPRRLLKVKHGYLKPPPKGLPVFIPDPDSGDKSRYSIPILVKGGKEASDMLMKAHGVQYELHRVFRYLYNHSRTVHLNSYITVFRAPWGTKYKDTLLYWSKVQKLTLHQRAANPLGSQKVSKIDLALSEGVGRKLLVAYSTMPTEQKKIRRFIRSHSNALRKLKATKNKKVIADKLLRLVLRHNARQITGTLARDMEVVKKLLEAEGGGFKKILKPRKPGSFPYS